MAVTKLAEKLNLANWMKTHGKICPPLQLVTSEYDAVVDKLVAEIKNITPEDIPALKEIYSENSSLLKSKEKFHALVDEFGAGNFANLEKFALFLKKSAQMEHISYVQNNLHILARYYIQLKNFPNDKEVKVVLERSLEWFNFDSDLDGLIIKIQAEDFTEIDAKINKYVKLAKSMFDFEKELMENFKLIW